MCTNLYDVFAFKVLFVMVLDISGYVFFLLETLPTSVSIIALKLSQDP